jgi:hypothetical protein
MKLFKKKEPPKQLTRTEALTCVPQKSPAVVWRILDSGELLLECPLRIQPFFITLAKRLSKGADENPTRKIQLDTLGRLVWTMVDGRKNVALIIQEFSTASGLSVQEAEISVTTFLRELGRRGLILMQ